ncbi:MAG: phosphatidate cytidylyltransferase [Phycisphaerales bacterium]
MKHRLLLGPVLIALVIGAFWLDEAVAGKWLGGSAYVPRGLVLMMVSVCVCAVATLELKLIFRACGIPTFRGVLLASSIAGLLVPWLVGANVNPLTAVALTASVATLVLCGALLWHAYKRRPGARKKPLERGESGTDTAAEPARVYGAELRGAAAAGGAALLTFVYLGLMFGFVLALRREHSAWTVLAVLLITKSCDIGAFFTGTFVGRHKLIPWLSKGKTWEGLAGGVVTAAALGMLAVWLSERYQVGHLPAGVTVWLGGVYGGLFALAGQAGDLMASMFKRDAGIKDSGAIVPGFGGVLDVIDSILPVAPLAYWLLHVP